MKDHKARARLIEQTGVFILCVGIAVSLFFLIDMAAMETRWNWGREFAVFQGAPFQYMYKIFPLLCLSIFPVIFGVALVVYAEFVRKGR